MKSYEVSIELQRWLKERRDEIPTLSVSWHEVDNLLEDVREAAIEGLLPWQRDNLKEKKL